MDRSLARSLDRSWNYYWRWRRQAHKSDHSRWVAADKPVIRPRHPWPVCFRLAVAELLFERFQRRERFCLAVARLDRLEFCSRLAGIGIDTEQQKFRGEIGRASCRERVWGGVVVD